MSDVRNSGGRRAVAHGPPSGLLAGAMLLVVASVIFGGASRDNPLRLAGVELASLPLGMLALRRLFRRRAWSGNVFALCLLCIIVALPLLQLIDLPPDLWRRLPGRGALAAVVEAGGFSRVWRPISLSPDDTRTAALALAPPAAMFLAAMQMDIREVRLVAGMWVALATAGLGLGVGQLIAPQGGAAWLYSNTNYGSLVGFFANRNHEASFLLAMIPFAAAFTASVRPPALFAHPSAWLCGLFLVLAIVGLGVVRSRAGVLLVLPAVGAALALVWRARGAGSRWRGTAAVAAMVALAVAAVGLFSLGPVLQRFAPQAEPYSRAQAWPHVEEAAMALMPFGAGVGAFDRLYRQVEPLTMVAPVYFNHAHNDYLELWLETGVVGAAIFAAFLVWLAPSVARPWLSGGAASVWACAASISVMLLLAHSLVDYPLRTTTLSVLFAFCCGLLTAKSAPSA
ncbi:MAG TPA: O-antigen ligase family protein [Caulobacteraceae bacterium]